MIVDEIWSVWEIWCFWRLMAVFEMSRDETVFDPGGCR